jgi:hypothetical protein
MPKIKDCQDKFLVIVIEYPKMKLEEFDIIESDTMLDIKHAIWRRKNEKKQNNMPDMWNPS